MSCSCSRDSQCCLPKTGVYDLEKIKKDLGDEAASVCITTVGAVAFHTTAGADTKTDQGNDGHKEES